MAVRTFRFTARLLDTAGLIKENSLILARQMQQHGLLSILVVLSGLVVPGKVADWGYNSKQNCFCLKSWAKEDLDKMLKLFIDNGFSADSKGEVDIVNGVHTGKPILVVKYADRLRFDRLFTMANRLLSAKPAGAVAASAAVTALRC